MGGRDAEVVEPLDCGTCMGAIVPCRRLSDERRSGDRRFAKNREPRVPAEEERRRAGARIADLPFPKESERLPFVLQPRIVRRVARDLDDGLRLGVLPREEEEERFGIAVP